MSESDSIETPAVAPVLREASRLFNEKRYFECHDCLEDAWSDAKGETRAFFHALIHAAVGMVHVSNANHKGAVHLLSRAQTGLAPFGPERAGLDVAALIKETKVCLDKSRRALAGEPIVWEPTDVPRMVWLARHS